MNKEFSTIPGKGSAGEQTRAPQDSHEKVRQQPILRIASNFYAFLFSTEIYAVEVIAARCTLWVCTPNVVLENVYRLFKDELPFKITMQMEISKKGQLINGSLYCSLGVGEEATTSWKAIEHGCSVTAGCLRVYLLDQFVFTVIPIPKEETLQLRPWRPLTLSRTSYMVLAKMLSTMLRSWLQDTTHDSQTGFGQDRSILIIPECSIQHKAKIKQAVARSTSFTMITLPESESCKADLCETFLQMHVTTRPNCW